MFVDFKCSTNWISLKIQFFVLCFDLQSVKPGLIEIYFAMQTFSVTSRIWKDIEGLGTHL